MLGYTELVDMSGISTETVPEIFYAFDHDVQSPIHKTESDE